MLPLQIFCFHFFFLAGDVEPDEDDDDAGGLNPNNDQRNVDGLSRSPTDAGDLASPVRDVYVVVSSPRGGTPSGSTVNNNRVLLDDVSTTSSSSSCSADLSPTVAARQQQQPRNQSSVSRLSGSDAGAKRKPTLVTNRNRNTKKLRSETASLTSGRSSRGGAPTRRGSVTNTVADYVLAKLDAHEDENNDLEAFERQNAAAVELKTIELNSLHRSAMEVKKMEVDEIRRHNENLEAIQRAKLEQDQRLRSIDIARAEMSLYEEMRQKYSMELIASLHPNLIPFMRKEELTLQQRRRFTALYRRINATVTLEIDDGDNEE